MSDFFKKLSICMEKHSEKRMRAGVLVIALTGLGLKTIMAKGRRK